MQKERQLAQDLGDAASAILKVKSFIFASTKKRRRCICAAAFVRYEY
tara:strand:- start:618 stop:758 length:141 start_codon:yes stop_codon:yes gene_type:complete